MAMFSGLYGEDYATRGGIPGLKNVRHALRGRAKTALREAIDTVAAGSSINGAAAVTRPEINLDVMSVGGARAIDTITLIDASSTVAAADATLVDTLVEPLAGISGGVVDLSGNGGGGKGSNVAPRLG